MRILVLAVGLVSSPSIVNACGMSPGAALIHNSVPDDLPKDFIVADVSIVETTPKAYDREGLHAEVRRVVRGPAARQLVLRVSLASSCDAPFANGRSGFVVGKIVSGSAKGMLVVDPVLAWHANGFRLTPDDVKALGRW